MVSNSNPFYGNPYYIYLYKTHEAAGSLAYFQFFVVFLFLSLFFNIFIVLALSLIEVFRQIQLSLQAFSFRSNNGFQSTDGCVGCT